MALIGQTARDRSDHHRAQLRRLVRKPRAGGEELRSGGGLERERGTEALKICQFESYRHSSYPEPVKTLPPTLSPDGLRTALRAFCEKHPIRRLDVFGSAARGQASPRSDVDLLVTLDDSVPVSTLEILEMAGEAEELVGVPVDFVLRQALDQSPNGFAREHILATAVQLYGR